MEIEEEQYAEEAGNEDEKEKMDEHEEEVQKAKKVTRKRWTDPGVKELKIYFKTFLKSGRTPISTFIDEMKKKGRKNHSYIHLRENHLIVQNISNMNHAKR